jgi:V/A-type H+-transporting ATPase subunit D
MTRLAATRMNWLRARRQLDQVRRGTELLRRKREALVAEVFRLARPAADARALIEARTREAYPALLGALSRHGVFGLRALGWPLRDLTIEIAPRQVWGIPVSDVVARPPIVRTVARRGVAPGPAGPDAVETALQFERLVDLLLDAAPREMLIRRLGEALGQTSRQVTTLERRVAPELAGEIARVRRQLQEREREEQFRLKHLLRKRQARVPAEPPSR